MRLRGFLWRDAFACLRPLTARVITMGFSAVPEGEAAADGAIYLARLRFDGPLTPRCLFIRACRRLIYSCSVHFSTACLRGAPRFWRVITFDEAGAERDEAFGALDFRRDFLDGRRDYGGIIFAEMSDD